jgi:hypothetical protein
MNSKAWPIEKFDRPVTRRIVMVIPPGIIPMPVLVCSLRKGFLGLGTRHCLSVLVSGVELEIRYTAGDTARLKVQSWFIVSFVVRPVAGESCKSKNLAITIPRGRRNCPAEERGFCA